MSVPATPAAWQALIIAEVQDENGILAAQMGTIWAVAGLLAATPYTQYLAAKREAILAVMGQVRNLVTEQVGDFRSADSDRVKALQAMLAAVERLQAASLFSTPPAIGTITRVTPAVAGEYVSPTLVDANDERYRGSVYIPIIPSDVR